MKIDILSHRGSYLGVENSLETIRQAIDKGHDWMEFDARHTKDGRIVVMHDSSISRMTDGSGVISKMTFKEIRSFRLVNDELIPSIEDVYEVCRGKAKLWVHVKTGWKLGCAVQDFIDEKGIHSKAVISTIRPWLARSLKKRNPKVQVNLLSPIPYPNWITRNWLKVDSVQPKFFIRKWFVTRAKKKGLRVLSWPVYKEKHIDMHIKSGVDFICTGLDELVEKIKNKYN